MLIALQILGGFALLILGSELLVRGASRLAALLGMTPLVIGLTVVAFGTSSPELAVSIQSVFTGKAGLAVGNAVGSNILNILLVLGVAATIIPLTVKRQVVVLDVPVMICASIALLLVSLDGQLSRVEGIAFVVSLVIYITVIIKISRRETKREKEKLLAGLSDEDALALLNSDAPRATVFFVYLGLLVGGLAILGYGCNLFVSGSESLARLMGVSDLVIGLTVVSVGTSLPELVTTIVACMKGERDMAVGNIVGSNMFNILCVLGVTASISPDSIPITQDAIRIHIPVALGAAILCMPVFVSGLKISRGEGILMLVLYAAYLTYLLVNA